MESYSETIVSICSVICLSSESSAPVNPEENIHSAADKRMRSFP